MDQIRTSPHKVFQNPHERELRSLDPALFKPIPPSLLPLLPVLKTLLERTAPKEPEKTTPAPAPPPDSYDLVGAATFLGRSPRWLRDNCVSLGIGHERVGRGYRFTLHELERYLARHRRKGKKGVYEA